MKTTTLKKQLEAHNMRIAYRKTLMKSFVGGAVMGIIAWELGAFLTDIIIGLIS